MILTRTYADVPQGSAYIVPADHPTLAKLGIEAPEGSEVLLLHPADVDDDGWDDELIEREIGRPASPGEETSRGE